MKKILVVPLALCLCLLFCVNALAASTFVITDKKTLQNFENGDPTEENFGGNTGWGGHWIETELSSTAGLEGNTALKMDFGESDEGTIGGVHADNIGTSEELNDWTPGMALLYRIKNPSSSSLNISSTIDVLDENGAGRARMWPENAQTLLDLSYNPLETVAADALSRDGVTWAGRMVYVTIPAGFDGYILCDLSKYVDDVEQQFESIEPDSRVGQGWRAEVKHLVLLTQDCMGKSLIVDDFRLVDYELVEIAEAAPEPEPEPEPAPATETPPAAAEPAAPSPSTGDFGMIAFIGMMIAAATCVFCKKAKNTALPF
ncbi:MAG: hypothetical protein FWG34_10810 [Oscillospiraceae bacterium]|nr:hypothetical protein [Oscillospiraceae bacterium]